MPGSRAALGRIGCGLAAGALVLGAAAAATGPSAPELVSRVPGNQGADGGSYDGAVTPNARYVVFRSYATNLVQGDTNNYADVFVRDRKGGKTTRVSVATDGAQGTGESDLPSISKNGRFVLFQSDAEDLVPGDDNLVQDVFLHDRKTGETRRVSVAEDGTQADGNSPVYGASLSASGRYAVFHSQATNLVAGTFNGDSQVYLVDLRTGAVTLVSRDAAGNPGNEASLDPSVSANGRFVAYYSRAGTIVPGDPIDIAKIYV